MLREKVTSTSLASVGYDAASKVLEIEFVGGGVYQYVNVPLDLYEGLMAASSHGTYFDQNVKKGGYAYVRVK